MKNILKGTIIFAVCLTLAACGTGSPQDITVQSITEPMVTMQTVGNVPEVTAVAENTDDWTDPAATEEPAELEVLIETDDTDNNNNMDIYDENGVVTGVTFPEIIDDWDHAYMVRDLFYDGVQQCSPRDTCGTFAGDFDEMNYQFREFVVEKFLDYPENFEPFGGAYWENGYLHIMLTDLDKRDIFSDFADNEYVIIETCKYSYSELWYIKSEIRETNASSAYGIRMNENVVSARVIAWEDREKILNALEAAGLDIEAVEIAADDEITATNPC